MSGRSEQFAFECLTAHWFLSMTDTEPRSSLATDDNENRTHTSRGWMTPVEYAAAAAGKAAE